MKRYRSKVNMIDELQLRIEENEAAINHPIQYTTFEDWRVIGAAGSPAFQNGWSNYGSGYATAAFWKDSSGIVRLRGLLVGGTTPATIFTLPVGYRPVFTLLFGIHSGGVEGRIDVLANGGVVHNSGSTGYVSLDSISFRAEQ